MPRKKSIDPLERPENFMNRELSWLEFNQRVLEEAQDPSIPLLERVKFLCIVCSNLDEFFEIRVAGIKQQIENKINDPGPDRIPSLEVFEAIRERATRMMHDLYDLWKNRLVPMLEANGIRFRSMESLTDEERAWAERYFHEEIFPVLTPLAIDPSHPFPQLLNKSLNIVLMLETPSQPGERRYAIVQVPRSLNRLVTMETRSPERHDFIFLSRLIEAHIETLFPGLKPLGAWPFRITRNSDLYIDDEEAQNLLRAIEEELRKRNRGNAVRLEVERSCPLTVQNYLLQKFRLERTDIYIVDEPLNLLRLLPITELPTRKELRDKSFTPQPAPAFLTDADMFDVIRSQDVLLHHPYESFQCVVDFLEQAAVDPKVLAIKMTLYRTSGDSPIVEALIDAANAGKQVTVVVELKARFDEANNILWAQRMENEGVHVVYGLVGLKTHSKMALVVRRDQDGIRHYAHLGTGNYHSKTARLYTDLGLFTSNETLTGEVARLFNALTGLSNYPRLEKLLVAPFEMADRFIGLIERERENAIAGKPARIFAKMNALVDDAIIKSLFRASIAGVKIDLIVRGICCLRPGLPGVSENICVRSIVGRYLEHSRIFYFENAGNPEILIGSADWMPRNLYRRVEVAFPVEDPRLKSRIVDQIIPVFMQDNVKARIVGADGLHKRIQCPKGGKAISSQEKFMQLAMEETAILRKANSLSETRRFMPMTSPPKSQRRLPLP